MLPDVNDLIQSDFRAPSVSVDMAFTFTENMIKNREYLLDISFFFYFVENILFLVSDKIINSPLQFRDNIFVDVIYRVLPLLYFH